MTSRFSRITTALASAVILAFGFSSFAYAEDAPSAETFPEVLFNTSAGDFVVRLYPDKAPLTVANFLATVESGHYQDTIFHRVINGFMIQGGGFTADMKKKPVSSASVQNEADNGLTNDIGTIAMARTGDPHSATVQFFINVNDNQNLNYTSKTTAGWGYTVFGEVISGFDVINTIRHAKTGRVGRMSNVPAETFVIRKATKL